MLHRLIVNFLTKPILYGKKCVFGTKMQRLIRYIIANRKNRVDTIAKVLLSVKGKSAFFATKGVY